MINRLVFLFTIVVAISCTKEEKPAQEILTEQTPWGQETFAIPQFAEAVYSIQNYEASPRKGVNNQSSIQKAIDDCHQNGGGTVLIPAGTWQTAYLTLKSNVNLHLQEGAVLSFLDSIPLYAVPTFTRWEGVECMNYHPLIYARDAESIAITGKGKIAGNGQKWWQMAKGGKEKSLSRLYDQVLAGVPPSKRICLNYSPTSYLRPSFVQFIGCQNVLVEDFEIGSGPMWTVHFVYCQNVVARNLKVITSGVNNDGIIPDACQKVLIDNCYFSTGDDCIVIKSGLNEDGWRVGRASERIVIKNCRTKHGHGGVVIGSEMSGGVNNVYAHDCDFGHTERGLRVKSMKGRGGVVENLWFKNIKMDSIYNEAIMINMNYGSSSIAPRNDSLPVFRNFNFENVSSTNSRYGIRIIGLSGKPVKQLSFKNIAVTGKYGIHLLYAENVTFDSVKVAAQVLSPLVLNNCQDITFQYLNAKALVDTMIALSGTNKNIKIRQSNSKEYGTPYTEQMPSDILVE